MRKAVLARLQRPTWNVREVMQQSITDTAKIPDHATLKRVAVLAGLPEPGPGIVDDLHHQLNFLEALQKVDTTGVTPLARLTPAVTCPDLETLGQPAPGPEWNPTSLASEHAGPYYVVKRGRTDGSNVD